MQPKDQNFLNFLQNQTASRQAVKGNGTGISDDVPAIVRDRTGKPVAQALLSEGEYVVKADVVSKLGGGATDPGVRFLDSLTALLDKMDRETATTFADTVLTMGEMYLDEQPEVKEVS